MKKCINGEYIEMTPEEIAEFEAMAAEMPAPEPTAEERLAALEEVTGKIKNALKVLGVKL